jgi:hypothetical protein
MILKKNPLQNGNLALWGVCSCSFSLRTLFWLIFDTPAVGSQGLKALSHKKNNDPVGKWIYDPQNLKK